MTFIAEKFGIELKPESLTRTIDQVKAVPLNRLLEMATEYGLKIGKGQPVWRVAMAVASFIQNEWYTKHRGGIMPKKVKKNHDDRVEEVGEEGTTENTASAPKERKERSLKSFTFSYDEEKAEAAGLGKVKGQYKLVLDLLKDAQGQTLDAKKVADMVAAHPELKTNSQPQRIANYYIFKLRHAGLVIPQ